MNQSLTIEIHCARLTAYSEEIIIIVICVHFPYAFLKLLLDFTIVTINLIQLLAAILIRINYLLHLLQIFIFRPWFGNPLLLL